MMIFEAESCRIRRRVYAADCLKNTSLNRVIVSTKYARLNAFQWSSPAAVAGGQLC